MSATITNPGRVRRKPRISDERLLDAACREFSAVGFDGAVMDRVAQNAGTTRMTLYSRFGSKQELWAAVVAREAAELRQRLFTEYDSDTGTTLADRLDRYISAYFEFGVERPDAFGLLLLPSSHELGFGPVLAEIAERISQLVAREDGAQEPGPGHRLIASLIVGAVHHGAGEHAASGKLPSELASLLTRLFIEHGVGMPRTAELAPYIRSDPS